MRQLMQFFFTPWPLCFNSPFFLTKKKFILSSPRVEQTISTMASEQRQSARLTQRNTLKKFSEKVSERRFTHHSLNQQHPFGPLPLHFILFFYMLLLYSVNKVRFHNWKIFIVIFSILLLQVLNLLTPLTLWLSVSDLSNQYFLVKILTINIFLSTLFILVYAYER